MTSVRYVPAISTDAGAIPVNTEVATHPAPVTVSASVGNSGDMMKSVYETDNDGVVDNAEALGGVSASSYIQTGNASWVDLTDGGTTTLDSHALASGVNWGNTLIAKLASDASTGADDNPISLSGLVFSFAANSTYTMQMFGAVSAGAATTGNGFQIDVSAAVTTVWHEHFHQLASTGTLSGGNSVADDASAGVSSGIPATGTYPVTGFGVLITGANTGTAQLRFRSETTAVATCRAGTTWIVTKVA